MQPILLREPPRPAAPPPAGPAAVPGDHEVTLHELLGVLLAHRWLILGSLVVAVALAALYTFTRKPEYETKSVLYVSKEQATPQLANLLINSAANRDVLNQVEILKSNTVARSVAARLVNLKRVPQTRAPLTVLEADPGEPTPTLQEVADRLSGGYVTVSLVSRDVNMVNVSVRSTDPHEAALVADLYAEEYVGYNRNEARARFRTAREYLAGLTSQVDSSLRGTESSIVQYQNTQGVVDPEVEAKELVAQLVELERRRGEVAASGAAARVEADAYQQQVQRLSPGIARRLAQSEELNIATLQQQRAQAIGELERVYAINPDQRASAQPAQDVARLRQQVDTYDRQITQRADAFTQDQLDDPVAAGAGSAGERGPDNFAIVREAAQQATRKRIESEQLRVTQGVLEGQIGDVRGRLARLPAQAALLGRLDLNVSTQAETYQQALGRLQEAQIAEQSELGNASIVDRAVVPEVPVAPRPVLNLALATVLGLVFGVGASLLRETLDTRVRRPEDLRKHGLVVLGSVPDMQKLVRRDFGGQESVQVDGHAFDTRLVTLLAPLAPASEAFRRLRTSIQYSRPDQPPQVIAVSSPNPGDGKSVTSLNLAIALAQSGRRTVYVDADLRKPTGHIKLGLPREPGLVDLLFEPLSDDFRAFQTPVEDFYAIPAGARSPNPLELVESVKMRQFVQHLREHFDAVVIDTPPVLAVSDAVVISTIVDGVVLVGTAGRTTWHMAVRSAEHFQEVGAPLLGTVLNRFDPEQGYGYGYGYGYGEQSPYTDRDDVLPKRRRRSR